MNSVCFDPSRNSGDITPAAEAVIAMRHVALPAVTPVLEGNIIFWLRDNAEIMSIRPDGFYVRGVKLEQDEKEAREVYDAMKLWLKNSGSL